MRLGDERHVVCSLSLIFAWALEAEALDAGRVLVGEAAAVEAFEEEAEVLGLELGVLHAEVAAGRVPVDALDRGEGLDASGPWP